MVEFGASDRGVRHTAFLARALLAGRWDTTWERPNAHLIP
jgi:hypothetical protein